MSAQDAPTAFYSNNYEEVQRETALIELYIAHRQSTSPYWESEGGVAATRATRETADASPQELQGAFFISTSTRNRRKHGQKGKLRLQNCATSSLQGTKEIQSSTCHCAGKRQRAASPPARHNARQQRSISKATVPRDRTTTYKTPQNARSSGACRLMLCCIPSILEESHVPTSKPHGRALTQINRQCH